MVEAATVRRLLETIEQRLSRLAQAAGTPLEEYLDDVREFVAELTEHLEPRG